MITVEVREEGNLVLSTEQRHTASPLHLAAPGESCLPNESFSLPLHEPLHASSAHLALPFPSPRQEGATVVLNGLTDNLSFPWEPPAFRDPATGEWMAYFGGVAAAEKIAAEEVVVTLHGTTRCTVPVPASRLVEFATWDQVASACEPIERVEIKLATSKPNADLTRPSSLCTEGRAGAYSLPDGTSLCYGFTLYSCDEGERVSDTAD